MSLTDKMQLVLGRLAPKGETNLDGDLFPGSASSGELLSTGSGGLGPSTKLWERPSEGAQAFIGIRETVPLPDYPKLAARLAGAALERGVVPIIFSTLPESGFTRYGFRIERIEADMAESRGEAQLRAFWDVAIVIDADQIAGLS